MKITVVKEFVFDAAHFLPNYEGPCKRLHGHRFIIHIGFRGAVDEMTGMVLDFKIIKEMLSPIVNELDHRCLNECPLPSFPKLLPTAENIVQFLVRQIQKQHLSYDLVLVRLYETPTSYAEWRA